MKAVFRVLVVDDDFLLRRSLNLLFTANGYAVLEAESGNSAIKLLRENPIDLILSDIDMPDGNGFELLRALQSFPNPPIVFLMSGSSDFSSQEFKEFGVMEFFHKPILAEALMIVTKKFFNERIQALNGMI